MYSGMLWTRNREAPRGSSELPQKQQNFPDGRSEKTSANHEYVKVTQFLNISPSCSLRCFPCHKNLVGASRTPLFTWSSIVLSQKFRHISMEIHVGAAWAGNLFRRVREGDFVSRPISRPVYAFRSCRTCYSPETFSGTPHTSSTKCYGSFSFC